MHYCQLFITRPEHLVFAIICFYLFPLKPRESEEEKIRKKEEIKKKQVTLKISNHLGELFFFPLLIFIICHPYLFLFVFVVVFNSHANQYHISIMYRKLKERHKKKSEERTRRENSKDVLVNMRDPRQFRQNKKCPKVNQQTSKMFMWEYLQMKMIQSKPNRKIFQKIWTSNCLAIKINNKKNLWKVFSFSFSFRFIWN